jgi:glycosyltransferase involved in cell wall biosynthesis
MRIIFDMTFPAILRTGTSVYAYQLADALERTSSVDIRYFNAPVKAGTASLVGKLVKWARITAWMQMSLPLHILKHKGDVLHEPSFFGPFWSPCPLVVVIHDVIYKRYPRYYPGPWRLYLNFSMSIIARTAARIITDSESSKRDVARYYDVPLTRIRVVYLGVDRQYHKMDSKRANTYIRDKYGLSRPYVLCVGAQEPRKNVPRVLQAFALLSGSLRSSHVVVAGVKGSATEEIVGTAETLGIRSQVRFLGYVPTEDLPALYNSASLFVFPSLYEGFGLPVLEAMACGTPTVASNTSSIPEVCADAAILVDPLDVTAMAQAMEHVLVDDDLRRGLVARGLERARHFTWDRTARETLAVYRELIGAE